MIILDKRAVIHELQRMRGDRGVSEPTFYRWLDILAITPKRLYSEHEVMELKRVALHFQMGGTLEELKQILKEEQCTNAN